MSSHVPDHREDTMDEAELRDDDLHEKRMARLQREREAKEVMQAENKRLRAALKPFAEIGSKIRHAVGGTKAFPPGTSARFLNLEPLTVQHLVDAANALEQGAKDTEDRANADSQTGCGSTR